MELKDKHTQSLSKGKNTEIGVIPEDWEIVKIGDISESYSGGTPSSKVAAYYGGNINWITSGELNQKKIFETDGYITKLGLENSSTKLVYPETLLFAMYGATAGVVAISKIEGAINQAVLAILNDKFISDTYFLYNYLHFKKDWIIITYTQGGQPNLSGSIIKKIQIPLPPLPEQQKIAEVLSDTDALIQSLKKLIQKKKNLKQGAMQELLTPKEDWEVKRLGEIGKTIGGLRGKTKSDFDNGNGKYITFLNVMNNVVIDATILEKVFIKSGEKQNTFLYGDLFFNTSSETPEEVGMCAILLENIDNLYLNSFCFGYRLNNDFELDGLFLSYIINSSIGRKIFESLAQGATRYNLSKTNFNNVELYVPKSKSEQTRIAQILSDMDVEIALLEKQLQKTENLKQGMMQELLTGKIRLVAAQTKNIMSKFKTT